MFTLLSVAALGYTVHESQTVGGVMSYQADINWMRMDVPKVGVKPYEHRQLLSQMTHVLFSRFSKRFQYLDESSSFNAKCIR